MPYALPYLLRITAYLLDLFILDSCMSSGLPEVTLELTALLRLWQKSDGSDARTEPTTLDRMYIWLRYKSLLYLILPSTYN